MRRASKRHEVRDPTGRQLTPPERLISIVGPASVGSHLVANARGQPICAAWRHTSMTLIITAKTSVWAAIWDWIAHLNYGDVPTWVAAIGTVATLAFAAQTIRQQSGALREERERRDGERKQQELSRARLIAVKVDVVGEPDGDHQRLLTRYVEEVLGGNVTGWRPATYVLVQNASSAAILDVEVQLGPLVPQHAWKPDAPRLEPTTTLPILGSSAIAYFVFRQMDKMDAANIPAKVTFTDEDGHRWETNLDGNPRRVDPPSATGKK